MTDIKEITSDGFTLGDTSLALLSLKLSLKAYFSTYKTMKYSLHVFSQEYVEKYGLDSEVIDRTHSSEYLESSYEAIVHFHHFVELICKSFLRDEDPLLVDFASSYHHVILHKLINGEKLSETDYQKLKSIGFGLAIERLRALIKSERINEFQQWYFFIKYYESLKQLNLLRNRVIHRGIYVLRYPALDRFFGEFALPFLNKVLLIDKYSGKEKFWKYLTLKCGIDPIEQIIEEFNNNGGKFNLGKIAFLKELGRAAYEQPQGISWRAKEVGGKQYRPFFFDNVKQQRAELIVKSETSNFAEVRECPVCGVFSLAIFDEIELEGEDYLKGTYEKAWQYTWQALCMCCSFEVNRQLDNPKEYGIPFDDYWYGEELK